MGNLWYCSLITSFIHVILSILINIKYAYFRFSYSLHDDDDAQTRTHIFISYHSIHKLWFNVWNGAWNGRASSHFIANSMNSALHFVSFRRFIEIRLIILIPFYTIGRIEMREWVCGLNYMILNRNRFCFYSVSRFDFFVSGEKLNGLNALTKERERETRRQKWRKKQSGKRRKNI